MKSPDLLHWIWKTLWRPLRITMRENSSGLKGSANCMLSPSSTNVRRCFGSPSWSKMPSISDDRSVNRHAFGTPPNVNGRVLICQRNLWTEEVPIGADRDPFCLREYSFGSNC